MDAALLLARLLLAVVFAVAALAKLADRAGTRQAVARFGVPAVLAPPIAVLLPLLELAVAVALLPTGAAWAGSVGALVLLAAFSVGIALNLLRGRRPDCHCFGQLASGPIGWSTLARNAALAAVAGFIVWQGREDAGTSAVTWLADLNGAERLALLNGILALGLGTAVLWLLLQLVSQNGRLLARMETMEAMLAAGTGVAPAAVAMPGAVSAAGLPVGTPAPTFQLPGLHGETQTLDALRATGKPLLLTFMDPNCGPCNALLPDVARWQRKLAGTLTLAVISRGTPEENRVKSTEHGLTHVLLQQDREVAQAYEAHGTPSMVLVRPDGTIGSPLAGGAEQIRALVARVMTLGAATPPAADALPVLSPNGHGPCPRCGQHHGHEPHGTLAAPPQLSTVRVGESAPPLKLPDLTGRAVDLADFRGRDTLVLFWNPACGFCQQMLPDLKAWEQRPPAGAPQLLVISTGTAEENASMGLRAPVLLAPDFTTGFAFGATGTPSAVLIDADGAIASPIAVGAQAVLALARGSQEQLDA